MESCDPEQLHDCPPAVAKPRWEPPTLPSRCLWSPDGKNEKEPRFPSFTYSPCSTNSVPKPQPKYTLPHPFQHIPILSKRKGRRRKRGRREMEDQREGQGSLYLSVRSGGPDVNPPNEPRSTGVAGKSQFWLHVGTVSLTCFFVVFVTITGNGLLQRILPLCLLN